MHRCGVSLRLRVMYMREVRDAWKGVGFPGLLALRGDDETLTII